MTHQARAHQENDDCARVRTSAHRLAREIVTEIWRRKIIAHASPLLPCAAHRMPLWPAARTSLCRGLAHIFSRCNIVASARTRKARKNQASKSNKSRSEINSAAASSRISHRHAQCTASASLVSLVTATLTHMWHSLARISFWYGSRKGKSHQAWA